MASQYLQQLTAVSSIAGTYLLPVSDDPSGTGRLKKGTFSQVLDYIEANIDSSTNPMTIDNILISDRNITNSIFIGASAGALVTAGAYNVVVGNAAGRTFTDASYNAFFGGFAGENVTGSSNTLLGSGCAGTLTSGIECVVIGALADVAAASNNNSIVIGKGSVGLGSNTTVIGNSNTTSTKLFGTVTAGNVVITNPASSATLTIADGTTLTGNQNVSTTASPQFAYLGVGTAASTTALIESMLNYTDPSGTVVSGIRVSSSSNTISSNNANVFMGTQCTLRLDQNGFNATASTGSLRGTSNTVYGYGASGAITLTTAYYAQVGNQGAGTVTTATGFHVAAGQNSGGGTLTNNVGFNVASQTNGTNIYGFRGQIASTSGRWNLYMEGTAANYLAGQISIGTTALTAKVAILDTAEQLRLLYDASNYVSLTVSSTGALTLDSVGSAPKFSFSDNVGFGTSTFGTSAAGGVIALSNTMTAPSSSPADIAQIYCADSAAANANIFARNENGKIERITGLCSRVSTQFDKTSSTTLGDVTGLSINVEAGRTYIFEAFLMTTSTTNGGVKAAISGTATATSIRYTGQTVSGSSVSNSRATSLGTAVGAVTSTTNPDITIIGTITVNAAGTLTVQFAQNASHTDTSSVLTGSYFKIQSTGD